MDTGRTRGQGPARRPRGTGSRLRCAAARPRGSLSSRWSSRTPAPLSPFPSRLGGGLPPSRTESEGRPGGGASLDRPPSVYTVSLRPRTEKGRLASGLCSGLPPSADPEASRAGCAAPGPRTAPTLPDPGMLRTAPKDGHRSKSCTFQTKEAPQLA